MAKSAGEPAWLHALMLDWADPLTHFAYDHLGKLAESQALARQVFLRLLHPAPEEAPHAGDLFERADLLMRRRGRAEEKGGGGWLAAVRRLSPEDRRWCWLAAYGPWSFEVLAASAGMPPDTVSLALERAWWGLNSTGARPRSEAEWRQWLAEVGPPAPPAHLTFDWAAWNPGARPPRMPSRIRPRHAAVMAAVLVLLGVGADAVRSAALASVPPLPFPAGTAVALRLLVDQGPPVDRASFGAGAGGTLPSVRVAPGLARYQVTSDRASDLSAAYQIGRLQVAWAKSPHGMALVIRNPAGPAPTVYNLASRGQRVKGLEEAHGFVVYQFPGLAGAVRVEPAGRPSQGTTLAWAPLAGPHRWIHVDSGVWSAAAGQPVPRGPGGTWVYEAPPVAGGRVVGVLASGVLWERQGRWWLLPVRGPAVPLVHVLAGSPGSLQAATPLAPYPGAAESVLVSVVDPAQTRGSSTLWWNLARGQWEHITLNAPGFLTQALRAGWVLPGPTPQLVTYGSPPGLLTMGQDMWVLAAWDHQVFGLKLSAGGAVAGAGTYGWRHRTYTPAALRQSGEAEAFPVWGPTYLSRAPLGGAPRQVFSNGSIKGPATIYLTAANGQHRATVQLGRTDTLLWERRWLLVESAAGGHRTMKAAWPNAQGRLTWHVLATGSASNLQSGPGFVSWQKNGHTYIWMPPFEALSAP